MRLFHNHFLLWRQPLLCCHGTEWCKAGGLIVQRLGFLCTYDEGSLRDIKGTTPWTSLKLRCVYIYIIFIITYVDIMGVVGVVRCGCRCLCCWLLHVVAPICIFWYLLCSDLNQASESSEALSIPSFRYVMFIPFPNDFDIFWSSSWFLSDSVRFNDQLHAGTLHKVSGR